MQSSSDAPLSNDRRSPTHPSDHRKRHHGLPSMRPDRSHILIAEDDPDMRALIRDQLESAGYEVQVLSDGAHLRAHVEAALEGRRTVPDLIISDIRMPGASGLEVLARLRDADWATPVVLITAFGDAPTHAEAQRLGAVTLLDKPFELNDLVTLVEDLVPPVV